MRCLSCDCNLSDRESTRKHTITGEYLDLCDSCLQDVEEIIEIPHVDRPDLALILVEVDEGTY